MPDPNAIGAGVLLGLSIACSLCNLFFPRPHGD